MNTYIYRINQEFSNQSIDLNLPNISKSQKNYAELLFDKMFKKCDLKDQNEILNLAHNAERLNGASWTTRDIQELKKITYTCADIAIVAYMTFKGLVLALQLRNFLALKCASLCSPAVLTAALTIHSYAIPIVCVGLVISLATRDRFPSLNEWVLKPVIRTLLWTSFFHITVSIGSFAVTILLTETIFKKYVNTPDSEIRTAKNLWVDHFLKSKEIDVTRVPAKVDLALAQDVD